jgi:hypothetical protein
MPMITTASLFELSTSQRKFSPLLICRAPRPSDVALPNMVAKTARMSIAFPIGGMSTTAAVRCLVNRQPSRSPGEETSLLLLGVVTLLLGGAVVLFAFGQALGSKGRHQRAVDLAAVSAGR